MTQAPRMQTASPRQIPSHSNGQSNGHVDAPAAAETTPVTTAVVATWRVGRRAIATALPGVIDDPTNPTPVELAITISSDQTSAVIVDPVANQTIPLPQLRATGPAFCRRDSASGRVAHATAPGLAECTTSELIAGATAGRGYATTTAFAQLGIPGGRYQLVGVRAIDQDEQPVTR